MSKSGELCEDGCVRIRFGKVLKLSEACPDASFVSIFIFKKVFMKVPKSRSMVFEIYGRKYHISSIRDEGGILRGYCRERKKMVWIIDSKHLLFDDEFPIEAKKVK